MRSFALRGGDNDSLSTSRSFLWSFFECLSKPDLRVFIFLEFYKARYHSRAPPHVFLDKIFEVDAICSKLSTCVFTLDGLIKPFWAKISRALAAWSSRILTRNFLPFLMRFCSSQNAAERASFIIQRCDLPNIFTKPVHFTECQKLKG